jgi:hypothetical protein
MKDLSMKTLVVLTLTLALTLTASAKNSATAAQIEKAMDLISETAQGGVQKTILMPNQDAKEMLKDFAWKKYQIPPEEFEESWVPKEDSAWEIDSGAWSLSNLASAKIYVKSALQNAQNNDLSEPDEKAYQEALAKAKTAFEILGQASPVAYGVAPTGAVQCGVSFAALIVMDLENGIVYEVAMEGSGC